MTGIFTKETYYPDECKLHKGMPFNCTIIEVETNFSRVNKLVDKAYDVLNGEVPDSNENCDYCKWNQEIIKFNTNLQYITI